jgi:hypothetical protein
MIDVKIFAYSSIDQRTEEKKYTKRTDLTENY